MWYKQPVKDRIELMKLYRKAYPNFKYKDAVEHFNNGGLKSEKLESNTLEKKTDPPVKNVESVMGKQHYIYTQEDLKNPILQNKAKCTKVDAHGNCLESTNLYFNKYVASDLKLPDTYKINEKYGIASGIDSSPYGPTADSWDIHGLLQEKGAIQNYAAPEYKTENTQLSKSEFYKHKWNSMSSEDKKKLYSQLAIGSLIGFGSENDIALSVDKPSYNAKKGLVANRHSARVIGFTKEGVPVINDYGKITTLDKPTVKIADFVTNITTPKEYSEYTYDKISKRESLIPSIPYDPNDKLEIRKGNIRKNEDSVNSTEVRFVDSINKNIKYLMDVTGASQEDVLKAGKVAFGILQAETRGGRGAPKAVLKEIFKTTLDPTGRILEEPSKGLTRIKSNMQAGDETNTYSQYLKQLGLEPKKLDLWDPEQAALATIALILSRKGNVDGIDKWYLKAQQHNTPYPNKQKMEYIQKGESDYANNVINNATRLYSKSTGYGVKEANEYILNKIKQNKSKNRPK